MCRTCDERIPSWLFRFHKQASEEQKIVRYESSSSYESMGTVAVQCRIAAERARRQKEMETTIAILEAELEAAVGGGKPVPNQTGLQEVMQKKRKEVERACPYGDGA